MKAKRAWQPMHRHPHSSSMKVECESKLACRIMVDLSSNDTIVDTCTIQKRQVDGSSCSSFNTKSTIATCSFFKYKTATSAISKMCVILCMRSGQIRQFTDIPFSVCLCACDLYQALFWSMPPPNFERLGARLVLLQQCCLVYGGLKLQWCTEFLTPAHNMTPGQRNARTSH